MTPAIIHQLLEKQLQVRDVPGVNETINVTIRPSRRGPIIDAYVRQTRDGTSIAVCFGANVMNGATVPATRYFPTHEAAVLAAVEWLRLRTGYWASLPKTDAEPLPQRAAVG